MAKKSMDKKSYLFAGGNMKIFKYVLRPTRIQDVQMHPGKILHVGEQGDNICVWALVDPDAPMETRRIAVVPTGEPCPYLREQHLGTALLHDGRLVFHIFEVTK
jgi:hypothetical protein